MSAINSYYANTESGPSLELNEDSLLVDVSNGLFGLIDGYGGSGIGDHVAEMIKETVSESYGVLSIDEDATMPLYFNANYSVETNALINSIHLAHSKVKEYNRNKETSSRGGASLLACTIGDNRLQFVGTGSCLALHFRNGAVKIGYYPHANSEISITGGNCSGSYPLSGIGLFDELDFFVQEVKVIPGDRCFLFSSGSYAPFNLTELSVLLNEFGADPELFKKELSMLAESRGFCGNQSIVCLEF